MYSLLRVSLYNFILWLISVKAIWEAGGGVGKILIINFRLNFGFKVKFSRHPSKKVRPKGKYTFDFITFGNNKKFRQILGNNI